MAEGVDNMDGVGRFIITTYEEQIFVESIISSMPRDIDAVAVGMETADGRHASVAATARQLDIDVVAGAVPTVAIYEKQSSCAWIIPWYDQLSDAAIEEGVDCVVVGEDMPQ